MTPALQQQLHHLLSAYGVIESIQPLHSGDNARQLVLVTMTTAEGAIAAQHALGFSIFGFSSLVVDENRLPAPGLRNTRLLE